MMNWNGNWSGSGWWVLMCVMMIAFWATVIWAVVAYSRRASGSDHSPGQTILDERLARGEITPAEYEELHQALRQHAHA